MDSTARATETTKFKFHELEAHQALSKTHGKSVGTPSLLGHDKLVCNPLYDSMRHLYHLLKGVLT